VVRLGGGAAPEAGVSAHGEGLRGQDGPAEVARLSARTDQRHIATERHLEGQRDSTDERIGEATVDAGDAFRAHVEADVEHPRNQVGLQVGDEITENGDGMDGKGEEDAYLQPLRQPDVQPEAERLTDAAAEHVPVVGVAEIELEGW